MRFVWIVELNMKKEKKRHLYIMKEGECSLLAMKLQILFYLQANNNFL